MNRLRSPVRHHCLEATLPFCVIARGLKEDVAAAQGERSRRHYHSVRVQGGEEVHRPDVPVTLDVAAAKFNVGGPVVSGVCGERC